MKHKNKKSVLIINRKNTDNFGDRLIYRTMKQLFEKDFDCFYLDYSFCPIIYSRNIIKRFLFKVLKHYYRTKCIRVLKKVDSIIIGGGELLSGDKVFYESFITWNNLFDSYCRNKKKFLFSVGICDSFSIEQKFAIQPFLKEYKKVFLRDYKSIAWYKENICSENVALIPDCVFSYVPFIKNNQLGKKVVLLGITSLSRHNKHSLITFYNWSSLFDYYFELIKNFSPASVVVFYDDLEDKDSAKDFVKYVKMKHGIKMPLADIKNEKGFVKTILNSDTIISPRMHACIIALSMH